MDCLFYVYLKYFDGSFLIHDVKFTQFHIDNFNSIYQLNASNYEETYTRAMASKY